MAIGATVCRNFEMENTIDLRERAMFGVPLADLLDLVVSEQWYAGPNGEDANSIKTGRSMTRLPDDDCCFHSPLASCW